MNRRAYNKSNHRAPDFLCVGAPKAATSWLYCSLMRLPGLFLPIVKETHYFRETSRHPPLWTKKLRIGEAEKLRFSFRSLKYLRDHDRIEDQLDHFCVDEVDDDWYRAVFSFAQEGQITGEVCPTYFVLPTPDIERVNAMNPEIRVVMLVRDPVDRCWSNIRMRKRRLGVEMDIERDFLETDGLKNFLDNSSYQQAITRWRECIGDRFRVFFFDDIVEQPNSVFAQVLDHIGYKQEEPEVPLGITNAGDSVPLPPGYRARLYELLGDQYSFLASINPERVEQWRIRHETILREMAC